MTASEKVRENEKMILGAIQDMAYELLVAYEEIEALKKQVYELENDKDYYKSMYEDFWNGKAL